MGGLLSKRKLKPFKPTFKQREQMVDYVLDGLSRAQAAKKARKEIDRRITSGMITSSIKICGEVATGKRKQRNPPSVHKPRVQRPLKITMDRWGYKMVSRRRSTYTKEQKEEIRKLAKTLSIAEIVIKLRRRPEYRYLAYTSVWGIVNPELKNKTRRRSYQPRQTYPVSYGIYDAKRRYWNVLPNLFPNMSKRPLDAYEVAKMLEPGTYFYQIADNYHGTTRYFQVNDEHRPVRQTKNHNHPR